jgi:hypothetical protein
MPTDAISEIVGRFGKAVEDSFAFLVSEFGFIYAGHQLVDVDDARERAVVGRFLKGSVRVEVRMNVIFLTISVFTSRYATPAECLGDSMPMAVLNLEMACPNSDGLSRPRWMKKPTLRGEALAGFKRYAKLMKVHLEEAVEFLGRRLRAAADEMGLR